MMVLQFKPWTRFKAFRDKKITHRWMTTVLNDAQYVFRRGLFGKHTGRIYKRGSRLHQASKNDGSEFPANDTGGLVASMRRHQSENEIGFGTNTFYARYLREGTPRMERRKMSDSALKVSTAANRGQNKGFVRWKRESTSR